MNVVILIPGQAAAFQNYARAVEASGAVPVFWTPGTRLPAFDGLLLPGGGDLAPSYYGQENVACADIDPARDESEWYVLSQAVMEGKPVLGICRGEQLINVFFGGTLCQDLPGHSRTDDRIDRLHQVRTAPSFLRTLYGAEVIVNSAHHQAVDVPGAQLRPIQWAPDGTVEALVHSTLPVWGVQWHPERMRGPFAKQGAANGDLLFQAFFKKCRKNFW